MEADSYLGCTVMELGGHAAVGNVIMVGVGLDGDAVHDLERHHFSGLNSCCCCGFHRCWLRLGDSGLHLRNSEHCVANAIDRQPAVLLTDARASK